MSVHMPCDNSLRHWFAVLRQMDEAPQMNGHDVAVRPVHDGPVTASNPEYQYQVKRGDER